MPLLADLEKIKQIATEKEAENDVFRIFLKQRDEGQIDSIVQKLNEEIAPGIDCTKCGNCCSSLLSVTNEEVSLVAAHLQISMSCFKEKYIEESDKGQMMMNTIPCNFLSGTICTVYEHRFTQCRDFPYLHKPNFTGRLFGTLMYYPKCPIIFNVVERLKIELGFKHT